MFNYASSWCGGSGFDDHVGGGSGCYASLEFDTLLADCLFDYLSSWHVGSGFDVPVQRDRWFSYPSSWHSSGLFGSHSSGFHAPGDDFLSIILLLCVVLLALMPLSLIICLILTMVDC